jgi:predicted DNA-binding transcriptional regulator YafY
MSRAERLFGLSQYLNSKVGHTVEEIAEHFAVSERTVFRDLGALEDQGIPIDFSDSRYRIHDARSAPISLDSGELALVTVALSNPALRRRRGPAARGLASLLAKLEAALRARRSDQAAARERKQD